MQDVVAQGVLAELLKGLEKEARKKYRNEINVQKIHENLLRDIFDALNLVFGYGDPGNFGDPDAAGGVEGAINRISSEEMSLMALMIIEWYLNDKNTLLCIQDPQTPDDSPDDSSADDYLDEYDYVYLKVLEKLHSLRNRFEDIKEARPGNYPGWVDEWGSCFRAEIKNHYEQTSSMRDKGKILRRLNLSTCMGMIVTCLILRCDKETGKIKMPKPNPGKAGKRFH